MELHLVIERAYGGCGDDAPHVFLHEWMPPPPATRCICGAVTWQEAVAAAYARRSRQYRTGISTDSAAVPGPEAQQLTLFPPLV